MHGTNPRDDDRQRAAHPSPRGREVDRVKVHILLVKIQE